MGCKNSKTGRLTLTTPLSGKISHRQGGTAMVGLNQCTKFEVSRFTRCEAMNGGAKCTNWGSWGALMGRSRSSAMSPSYSTLIETMCLSCTVFEI